MTRTGYACGMANTPPSDPDIVNTNALEGFMRAFDHAITGKYDLSGGAMVPLQPQSVMKPRPITTMGEYREKAHVSIWHTLPLLKTIIRFRDNIRLRRYNREWIKNNIH